MIEITKAVVLQSLTVFAIRLSLFFACRKYLLQSLYHDLQDLSSTTSHGSADPAQYTRLNSEEVELGTLPPPSNASKHHATREGKRPLHSILSRSLFALCFDESCILFFLLMCQGLDIFDPRTRALNWTISLAALLSSILVLSPLCLSLIVTYSSSSDTRSSKRSLIARSILTVSPVFIYLFLLSYIPLPAGLTSPGFITSALARLVVVGTIILGLLSGFGAISNAWAFFPVFWRHKRQDPSAQDIVAATEALNRVQMDLAQRRGELERLASSLKPESQSSWFSRVMPSLGGDSHTSSLNQEVRGLEALEYQMSRNLEDLKVREANATFSGTIAGRMFNFGGRMFAIYCIFRILSSIINVILPIRSQGSTNSVDLITHVLTYGLSLLPSVDIQDEDVALVSRQISLGLVGLIILSSVRLVLRGVTRALRVTNRNLGASLMLLIIAQLMGLYLLATLIQLRTSFPPSPAKPNAGTDTTDSNLFSTLPEFQVFGSMFDGSFLLAAALTSGVRWFNERVNGLGND